ncbi:MAG: Flp pilus assembly complex ATPase component TadA [Blastopirellula sp.]|nr:Flp pilus assembly complex ATPase component TadA [Blastopirellula sp.]
MDIGQILIRRELATQAQINQVQEKGLDLLDWLMQNTDIDRPAAIKALADEMGMGYIDLREEKVDLGLLSSFPQKIIYREALFPVSRQNGSITVATSDPYNFYPLDEISAATGLAVVPVLADRVEIARLIKTHLGVGGETIEGLIEQKAEEGVELLEAIETDGSELSEMAQEASVVRLVNEILLEAIETRTSDVHIESQGSGLVIRYRIDGLLHAQPVPPEINHFQAAIISRLKIMARLNIAEKRLPQDGRIKLKVKGRTYVTFRQLIDLPHGIILVTGPTGSGKTTTLYSALIEINAPDTKIITTEDPVEYQLEGINQIQVHPKIGLTFGASLRSILRHDPDVVLVGEIRDLETAENAIQASLTGHLVFSTLHTNDASSAFNRMTDMGVEPFLVSSTVEGIMAQRLVRRLCPHCKIPYQPGKEDLPDDFPLDKLGGQPLYKSAGCRKCREVGYAGRLGIYELLVASERIRELAHDRVSSWEIKKAACEEGMSTLRDDGWMKVIAGKTSVDEVVRITKSDRGVTRK